MDKKKQTMETVCVGNTIVVKQNKSTVKSPFNPAPYRLQVVSGNDSTLERGNKKIKWSFNIKR